MRDELCWCSKHMVNVNDASFVALVHNMVRPFCAARCYNMFVESQNLKAELQRREWAAREVADDRIGNEVYAAYDYANEL